MNEDDLFRAAGLDPQLTAGMRLLTLDQVQSFLVVIEREGWVILGLDGFEIVEGGVRPDMDQLADWSSLNDVAVEDRSARSVGVTRQFLQSKARHDRLYEVVVCERG